MTSTCDTTVPVDSANGRCHECALLPDLLDQIGAGDDAAWTELAQHRTLFLWNGQRVNLIEFLQRLRETPWAFDLVGRSSFALDCAHALAQDRFGSPGWSGDGKPAASRSATKSAYYWRAVAQYVRSMEDGNPDIAALEWELTIASVLQAHVLRHFRLACQEARRNSNPTRTRYRWHKNGCVLTVWLPARMRGRERRRWLERNVPNPVPERPGERNRIQAIIDARLGTSECHALGADLSALPLFAPAEAALDNLANDDCPTRSLPEAVADEKAQSTNEQRPAIRALGPTAIKQLVLAVFEAMAEGSYNERILAQRFGLSSPTMSRFAGSRWRGHGLADIPDLFLNVAHMLAHEERLVEAAQAAGVWPTVSSIVEMVPNPRFRRDGHA